MATTPNRNYPLINNGSPYGDIDLVNDVATLLTFIGMVDADVQSVITALAGKVGSVSPAFSGSPTAPTQPTGDDSIKLANTAFVKAAISLAIANLVNGAPSTLDALNELAAALGNDPNFATTVATQLGLKANAADVTALLALKASLTGVETLTNKTLNSPIIVTPSGVVSTGVQTLPDAEKLQARKNVGLDGYEYLGRIAFTAVTAIDLGDLTNFRGLRLKLRAINSASTAYVVQLSIDGSNWVTSGYYMTSADNANGSFAGVTVGAQVGFRFNRYGGTPSSWVNSNLEIDNMKSENGLPVMSEGMSLLRQTDGGNYHSTWSQYMAGGGAYKFARIIPDGGGTMTGALNAWAIR